MAGMLRIAKCLGVGFAVAIFLWMCGQFGYRYLVLCKFLTSPAACPGKMICWGGVLGTAGGTVLLIGFLWVRKVRDTGYLIAGTTAFLLLAALRLSHLVMIFCS
jgi:hypothetical protein